MPVVFVEVGGVARSGHEYDDQTGVSYEYPRGRYENWVQSGDRFVYHVPGVGYIGAGVVGEIRPALAPDRLVCDVLDVRLFVEPVPLKTPCGRYYEQDPTYWRDKVFWGQGVRPLSNAYYDAIIQASDVSVDLVPPERGPGYPAPELADAVGRYAVRVVIPLVEARFGSRVTEMHHNNPGFDLLVGDTRQPERYVEVKGTQSIEARFFLSEGERLFSERNADRYSLVAVTGIDIARNRHSSVTSWDGPVESPRFVLRPAQWRVSATTHMESA